MNATPHNKSQTGDDDERVVGSDRVLAVLAELGRRHDGVTLDEMAQVIQGSKPTVHRALASLRRAGFARQDARGHYLLGDEFLRMAFAHHDARPDHVQVQPILEQLTSRFGETTHFAVLEGNDIVYRAKVDPTQGAMRLTSTIGGRNPAHTTAVGKLLLSQTLTTESAIEGWIGDRTLEARTSRSATTAPALHRLLSEIRDRGFSVDDEENEPGVNCLAVPIFLASRGVSSGGISISALAHRTSLASLVEDLDAIQTIVDPTRSTRVA